MIPLGTERFTFEDEVTDSSSVITRGDTLCIDIQGQFDPRTITENDLSIPGRDTTIQIEIGGISLDSIRTQCGDSIILHDIMPELECYLGNPVTVPETTLTSYPLTLESEDFQRAVIDRCDIKICVYNNLPLTLGPNSLSPEGMEINIYDSTGTHITGLYIPEEIPPGGCGCRVKSIVPGESWIRTPLQLEYSLPVSEDTTFVLTEETLYNSGCVMEVTLLNLDIKEIVGKISPQAITRNMSIAIPGRDRIIRGTIHSGYLDIDFYNQLPLGAELDITMPDLRPEESTPTCEFVTLVPSGHTTVERDLRENIITNSVSPGSPLDSLLIEIEAETGESDGFVHIRESDNISVEVHIREIEFSSLEGYLATHSLGIGPYEEKDVVDYQGLSGGLNFRHGQLMITFHNEFDIETMELDLEMTGYHREDGGSVSDSVTIEENNFRLSSGGDTLLLSGGEVVDLLNILPTDIVCSGLLEYSGYSSVSSGEGVECSYFLTTPFEIEILDTAPIRFDPDTLREGDLDETLRDAAGNDIKSAALRARITNHSPVGGELMLMVSADLSRTDPFDTTGYSTNRLEFIKSVRMEPAPADPATGLVEDAVISETGFPLSEDELRVFKTAPLVTVFKLTLEETGGRVILCGSDYIEFSGEVEMEILIKGEE